MAIAKIHCHRSNKFNPQASCLNPNDSANKKIRLRTQA